MAVIILGASPRGIQDYLIPEVYKWRSKLRGIPHPEANKKSLFKTAAQPCALFQISIYEYQLADI